MWNYLKRCMLNHKDCLISDTIEKYTFSDFIYWTEKNYSKISHASKCGIMCKRELNNAKGLLLCLESDVTAIPLPLKYGDELCQKIFDVTEFDFLITDDINLISKLNDYEGGIFLIGDDKVIAEAKQHIEKKIKASLIMSTSGTTGMPKCAMISESGLLANLLDIDKYFRINENSSILICRPIYHCAVLTGELLFSLMKGVNIFFYSLSFEPSKIVSEVEEKNITTLCATPTIFYHICNYLKRNNRKTSLKNVVISGEVLSEQTADTLRGTFIDINIYHVYGMTEASPRISALPPELFIKYPTSVGYTLSNIKVRIISLESNETCKEYMQGEIHVFGPNITTGYYKNQELTSEKIQTGWLKTGDIGYFDDNGLLYVVGRKDELIIRAGINIYPQEIEQKLIGEEIIKDIVVTKIKHKRSGDQLVFNICPDNDSVKVTQIMEVCRKKLPPHLLPDKVELVHSIKYNQSGKKIRQ